MARVCALTGKKPQFGNNRSHALNKTRRRFQPNLQSTRLWSEALGRMVRLTLSTHALRSVEHNGGLDPFLLKARDEQLSLEAKRLKKAVKAKQPDASAAA